MSNDFNDEEEVLKRVMAESMQNSN